MYNGDISSAILAISQSLRWGTDLTIFPYDMHTGVIMLESSSMDVDDIRARVEVTPNMLKVNPEEGAHLINQLLDHVDQLEKQVTQYNEEYNKERRNLRR